MTYTIASVHEVMNASRGRIGHVFVSSRGFRAFDAAGAFLGTYSSAEAAISAVAALPETLPRAARDGDISASNR